MISEFILILKVSGSNPGRFEIILPNRKIPEKINCRDRDGTGTATPGTGIGTGHGTAKKAGI